jgi:hypothetical protein
MVVPAFDVVTTIIRRGRSRKGVMTPDQSHTHHRLIRFGLNPKVTVIVLWGVTLFFGWQMLGLVAPFGLVYLLGSYAAALGVANLLLEQRRKNLRTMQSDLREEMLFLIGLRDAHDEEAASLREIIVDQIRREALYRRMVKDEAAGRTPESTIPSAMSPREAAADGSDGGEARSPGTALGVESENARRAADGQARSTDQQQ